MTAPVTPERSEAFAQALAQAGADAPFRDAGGLLYFLVPYWIVQAYARARLGRAEVRWALAVAALGEADAKACLAAPKALIWTLCAGWAGRLGELERKVRGVATKAAA